MDSATQQFLVNLTNVLLNYDLINVADRILKHGVHGFLNLENPNRQELVNKLSYKRLISNALLCDFIDIVEDYRRGGKDKIKAEKAMATYRNLINEALDND